MSLKLQLRGALNYLMSLIPLYGKYFIYSAILKLLCATALEPRE